ncbi:hypothetical protein AX14_008900 [Amanita brunnescens Koide BX004]|nr:hypothetical protein AX14_008900 [Amanita brunnescens Koide BX004]
MIIGSEKDVRQIRATRSSGRVRTPLTSRPVDLLYFCFFLIHVPATLLLDIQHLYPTDLVPSFVRTLLRLYIQMSNDPLVGGIAGYFTGTNPDQFVWFKSFIVLEAIFQLPVFFLGMRGLYNDSRAIYVLILLYGASTATTTLPCVAVIFQTPETTALTIAKNIASVTSAQRLLLLSSYIPFMIIPLIMAVDMAYRVLDLVKAGVRATDADKSK